MKKKTKKHVKVDDLAPKQDPKGGIIINWTPPNPTTSLDLNSSTTTLTSVNTTTVKP